MKRRFDHCFGEEEGMDELREDLFNEDRDEEDWKAPVTDGLTECKDGRRQQPFVPDHPRTIVHIDLDCFYAQVEMIRNSSLRDKPLGIQQKNIVVTTNYVAREHGVGKLSYIKDALQKCPDLVLVSGEDLTNYREMSYKVTGVLQRFEPVVERLGFDENYINVSALVEQRLGQLRHTDVSVTGHVYNNAKLPECSCGCHQRLALGSQIAKEMRDALYSKLGLTSCAGVAHNKLLAKLVGGHKKPNDQTLIYPEQAEQLMISLGKVRAIPGIGSSTGKRLAAMGICTVQDLQETSRSVLESEFGHQLAHRMLSLSHGIDETPVTSTGAPQSISDEDSFKKCSTIENAKERILGLLQNLLKRLKADGRTPQTIRVTVRKYSTQEWKRESRQCSVAVSLFKSLNTDENATVNKLLDICIGLFRKMVDTSKPFHLTLINICFAKMQDTTKSGNINHFFSPKSKSSVDESPERVKSNATPKGIDHFFSSNSRSSESTDCVNNSVRTVKGQRKSEISHFFSKKSRSSEHFSDTFDKSAGKMENNVKSQHIEDFFSTRSSHNFSIDSFNKLPTTMTDCKKSENNSNFSPKFDERTLLNDSCTKVKAFNETVEDTQTTSTNSCFRTTFAIASQPREHKGNSEVLFDKDTKRTNEAYFTLPKRKKPKTSESSPEANITSPNKNKTISGYERTDLNSNSFFNTKSHISKKIQKSDKIETNDRQSNLCDSDIPPNVDPDVFKQLPEDLQQELRAEYSASKNTDNSRRGSFSRTSQASPGPLPPSAGTDGLQQELPAEYFASKITDNSCKKNSSRTTQDLPESLLPSAGMDGALLENAEQISADSNSNLSTFEGHSDSHTIILPSSQSSSSKFDTNAKLIPRDDVPDVFRDLPSCTDRLIPPNVDPDVFRDLPSEMQHELI